MNIPNNPEFLSQPLEAECGYNAKGKSGGVVGGIQQRLYHAIGGGGDNEGLCIGGEYDPPDNLRYNGKGQIFVLNGSMKKTVLKRAITTLTRSEAKSVIQLCSKVHRQRLLTLVGPPIHNP